MISSYVGENKEFERQYLSGELEVGCIGGRDTGRKEAYSDVVFRSSGQVGGGRAGKRRRGQDMLDTEIDTR
jgi:hypothetical protein